MKNRFKFPRLFYGWWIVIISGLIPVWAMGYYAYGISALFKPISSELGFSRTETSVVGGIGKFEGGFEAPLVGWISDKWGPKWVTVTGVALITLSLFLMYFINSLWAFYIVWGVMLGTGCNISTSLSQDKSISDWFIRNRGKALGVKWAIAGLSGVIGLPIVALFINAFDWRIACLIGAVVMGVIFLPLSILVLKNRRPEHYGLLPDGGNVTSKSSESKPFHADNLELTARQTFKTRSFWLLTISTIAHSLVYPALSLHAIPFLTDRGIDPVLAAGMMALMIGASIPARFVFGYFVDKMKITHLGFLIGGSYLLEAAGITVFLLYPGTFSIYAWFILYGVGLGGGMMLGPVIRARYFGRKAFGSIQGVSTLCLTPIGILAPIYAGWVYDTSGSYTTAFTVFAVLLVAGGIIGCFAGPPKIKIQPIGKAI